MTTWKKALALLMAATAVFSLTACGGSEPEAPEAPEAKENIIVTNANVYTVDAEGTVADTVVIEDGVIAYVGDAAGSEEFKTEASRIIDAEGNTVLPTMVDAHMHPITTAIQYCFEVNLVDCFDEEEYLAAVAEFVEANPDLEVYMGAGFMRSAFDIVGPRKEALDEICADKPIILAGVDGHSVWVNSKAMELAGITKDTPDPAGGVIQRDPATGEPAGLLQESAMNLVMDLVPEYTKDQYKEAMRWLQGWLNERGITTVYDAIISTENPNQYMAYQEMAEDGELTVRVRGAWSLAPEMGDLDTLMGIVDKGIELSKGFTTDYFQVNSFKFFSDQVLEEETAYMSTGYLDHPDPEWKGIKVWDDDVMEALFTKIDAAGFQIHVHQIGDAAATYTLDAMEKAVAANGERDSRHTLAHVQFITEEDQQRLADLKMNAIIAPYWMAMDDYYWGLTVPAIGQELADNQYPAQSLFDKGVNTAVHSDFGVSEPEWGWLLYGGVTRTFSPKWFEEWGVAEAGFELTSDPNAEMIPDVTFGPLPQMGERLTLEEVIQAATYNGAYSMFLENEIGSIEVGKKADLVLFDMNIFEEDIETVSYVEPVLTLFDGNIVYEK